MEDSRLETQDQTYCQPFETVLLSRIMEASKVFVQGDPDLLPGSAKEEGPVPVG